MFARSFLLPRTHRFLLPSVRRAALRQSGVLRSCSLPSRALSPRGSDGVYSSTDLWQGDEVEMGPVMMVPRPSQLSAVSERSSSILKSSKLYSHYAVRITIKTEQHKVDQIKSFYISEGCCLLGQQHHGQGQEENGQTGEEGQLCPGMPPLDSVEVVGNGRMMAKLSSLLNNTSHPLQDTLTALGSSFSERLLHPRCVKERYRRSFLPAAVRLHNKQNAR
ncbi:hypothetical protein L3Q82_004552 [Scortum barcoo]|uniref:Uncharacterized protein n=1 Tax=Scortum barcoo TaxID=214431 RepID=A0ACB8VH83_9TELE|nr:hypothetical protein L3Q82_004552 [Scortum barcoo]